MSTVYVLNKDGKPLMPTTRCGHVRHLLKEQKARVVTSKPFTIQLLYETDDVVQPLYLGIDPGRTNIGVAVVKADGTAVFTAHLETRNKEIPKLMKKRKDSRRARRTNGRRCRRQRRAKANGTISKKCVKQTTAQNGSVSKRAKEIGVIKRHLPGCEKDVLCIGIKNKEAKFSNRTKSEGWLTPTANRVLNQIIPALTKELSSLFPKHFFATNGKSTYDYRAAHGVRKDHWLDAYCIACSVLPNDVCDKNINNRVLYELKQFRRHDRRALNNENMSRVYTLNKNVVATNRHKATKQTTDSLEEFRQNHPDDACKLKVKEHHPTYRNMSRNYPGSVFLVGNQVHVMQGVAGSKDGKATTYKDTNANSIAAGKCKFVAKNSGILFV